ncbi:MAG TPA: hypothetical protein DEB35_09735 [Desulfuromonas sp.]|nr:hypothetical protein [Desulfuromonas sp.]HBT83653.1 hypothetical protein [Desulfuromonas sp.]
MRRADIFGVLTASGLLLLLALVLRGSGPDPAEADRLTRLQRLVTEAQLTDLALLTEARYTRHPTQADHFAPFQDHPLALDHFPSGMFWSPRRPAP